MIRERALVAKKKFRVKKVKTALQNKTLPVSLDTAETVIDGMTDFDILSRLGQEIATLRKRFGTLWATMSLTFLRVHV